VNSIRLSLRMRAAARAWHLPAPSQARDPRATPVSDSPNGDVQPLRSLRATPERRSQSC
jgi:hypothetical protein